MESTTNGYVFSRAFFRYFMPVLDFENNKLGLVKTKWNENSDIYVKEPFPWWGKLLIALGIILAILGLLLWIKRCNDIREGKHKK